MHLHPQGLGHFTISTKALLDSAQSGSVPLQLIWVQALFLMYRWKRWYVLSLKARDDDHLVLYILFNIILVILTLVLLNPDIPCLCKQCRTRSVGFWRSQLIWICTVCHSVFEFCINKLDQGIWLADNQKWAWHLNSFSMTRAKTMEGR